MKITNKKAHFDYSLSETLEAGIDLDPQEVVLAEKSGSYRKAVCASTE